MEWKKNQNKKVLTVRYTSCNQTRGSSYNVGGSERDTSTDALDSEEDEEGGRELNQPGDQEVDVDVSSCDPQPHD